ncbi:uncharacterized protein [Rutidosis leptorrhynchoides]|uniref:uncharacterized protein n=1 Tax=Rutidosis leptorrhynchoides TaxID=125765 RepID=UPI003A99D1EE
MASDDSSLSSAEHVTKISALEFNDPLYLHSSDTSGASLITQKLKGTENYKEGQWDRCNSVVLTWILVSLSEDVYNGQIFSKSAETVWNELKETYDKVDASVTFNLYQQINSCSQFGLSLSDYYHKLNAMWRQFDEMVKIDDVVSANKSFQDHCKFLKLMQFLMGLDDVYTPIRSHILTSDHVPSVKVAFSIISWDESHRMHSENIHNAKSQPTAFVSKTGFNNNKKRFKNPPLKCTNCNMLGHIVDRCYELIGYPPGYIKKPFNQGSPRFNSNNCSTDKKDGCSSSVQLTSDQIMKLLSLIKDQPCVGNLDANMAGTFVNNNTLFNGNFNLFFSTNCMNTSEKFSNGWIIDSGAN